jgi:hypothetical protein
MNFPRLASLLRNLLHKEGEERELDEEVRAHEQLLVDENIQAGINPQQARRQARLELGGVEQVKEQIREIRAGHLLEALFQDVRYAARMMRRSPAFTITAVLTLALGIGANTAVFSVVNTVLLRPLPYPDSDRLVQLWSTNPNADHWGMWTAYPRFEDWRRQNTVFEEMATTRTWVINIKGSDHPESLLGVITSSQLLELLRVRPILGRGFLPEEDQPGHDHVILLSYGLWQRRFGSDPAVIGRTVNVGQENYTVIGVMPADFRFPPDLRASYRVDAWLPPAPDPSRDERVSNNYYTFARLKPGVTLEQAQAGMDAVSHGLAEKYDADRGLGVKVVSWQRQVGSEVRPALLILLGAISLVLLIACANVANLLLARGAVRQREVALRQALGAGHGRLIRQFMTESILLAVCGGVAGLLLAYEGLHLFIRLAPDIPRLNETTMDPRVLIYNALSDLKSRLSDPTISSLAQAKIFDKLGTDSNGNKLTTQSFLTYLNNNKPRFYDGTQSTYCYGSLTVLPEALCFRNGFLNFLNQEVKDVITAAGNVDASTGTPSNPLLAFFRPGAIGFNSSGQNLGNEQMLFHEALHGLTGKYDNQIQAALGLNGNAPSCVISVYIANHVLSLSAGLDPTVQSPCPDLFASLQHFVGLEPVRFDRNFPVHFLNRFFTRVSLND